MDTLQQMDHIVERLMDLDKEFRHVYTYYLQQDVKKALDNSEIYGDVREILEKLYDNLLHDKEIRFGLVAADICLYL